VWGQSYPIFGLLEIFYFLKTPKTVAKLVAICSTIESSINSHYYQKPWDQRPL